MEVVGGGGEDCHQQDAGMRTLSDMSCSLFNSSTQSNNHGE